jgi:hypothetical protein
MTWRVSSIRSYPVEVVGEAGTVAEAVEVKIPSPKAGGGGGSTPKSGKKGKKGTPGK